MKTALELVAEERHRQISKEGWSIAHDDNHIEGELARAGAAYILPLEYRQVQNRGPFAKLPVSWPWAAEWYKPTPEDRIRELVKGAALAVAEIERLQRIEHKELYTPAP